MSQHDTLTLEQIDAHLDAILRAAGSALRHYTTQKSLDDMRAALRAALSATQPASAQGAGEAYAYAVYFPDQPTEMLVHDLDELCEDMTNREHTVTQLFTQPAAGADVLDAGRYRWLRTALADRSNQGKSHWFCSIPEGAPSELDSAIDAALATHQQGEKA